MNRAQEERLLIDIYERLDMVVRLISLASSTCDNQKIKVNVDLAKVGLDQVATLVNQLTVE